MARIQKYASPQGLSTTSVFIEDTLPESKYFGIVELPKSLTGGKNAFLITGTEYLELGTTVLVEVLDSQGTPIYVEPGKGIPQYYESVSKVVSMYVYEDTPYGLGSITILGELKEYEDTDGIKRYIPDRWKDRYNVKWQHQILIDPLLANETKVRFYKRPILDINEIRKLVYVVTASLFTLDSGSVSSEAANPVSGSDFKTFIGDTEYRLTLTGSQATFLHSMQGLPLDIPSISYTPLIKEILSDKLALADLPYYVENTNNNTQIITEFNNLPYSISYVSSSDENSTALTSSFANINVRRLDTFAGDVNRIKLYRKSLNKVSDYELILDTTLESRELLVNTGSYNEEERTGYFFDLNHINTFWTTQSLDATVTPLVLSYNNSVLADCVALGGDTTINTTDTARYAFETINNIAITEAAEYTVQYKVIGKKTNLQNEGKLEVYISGSGVNSNDLGYGRLIETLTISNTLDNFNFKLIESNFIGDFDGRGVLKFVSYYGDWYVSDVSIKASQETAFSPDFVKYIVPMPTDLTNEIFKFKAEFFDVNSNKIPILVESNNIPFTGSNRVSLNAENEAISNIVFKGPWVSGSVYNLDNVVTYGLASPLVTTGSYIRTSANPTSTVPPLDASGSLNIPEWAVFAEGGATGSAGVSGSSGSGSQGPGLLYIGEYSTLNANEPTRPLNNNAIAQDAVSVSETYYAFIGTDGTTVSAAGAPPPGGNATWEEFAAFSAIATGLLIVENSFVKNTINIGTNASGSSANITLYGSGSSPYISIDQNTDGYGLDGIFMGMDGGSGKFSIVNGVNGYLKWDGSNLIISGGGAFSGDLTAANMTLSGYLNANGFLYGTNISGSNDGIYMNDDNYWYSTGFGKFGGTTNFITWTNSSIDIQSDVFRLDATNLDIDSSAQTITLGEGTIVIDGSGKTITVGDANETRMLATGISSIVSLGGDSGDATYTTNEMSSTQVTETTFWYAGSTTTGNIPTSLSGGAIVLAGSTLNYSVIANVGYRVSDSGTFGRMSIQIVDATGSVLSTKDTLSPFNNTSENVYDYDALGNTFTNTTGADYYVKISIYRTSGAGTVYFDIKDVLVGTSDVQTELGKDGFQTVNNADQYVRIKATDANFVYINNESVADYALRVDGPVGTTHGTTWTSISDVNLKKNINAITPPLGLTNILKLNPVEFDFKPGVVKDHRRRNGFIAQEYRDVFPESIVKMADGYLAMDNNDLFPALVSAIQYLTLKVAHLEKQVRGSTKIPTGSIPSNVTGSL